MVGAPFRGGDISELIFSRASMTLLKILDPPFFKKKHPLDEKGVFEENSQRSFHRRKKNLKILCSRHFSEKKIGPSGRKYLVSTNYGRCSVLGGDISELIN